MIAKRVLVFVSAFTVAISVKHQRLILPTTSSTLKIIPRVEMPMMSTNAINSGFQFKMPIAVQFPSMLEVVQSMRQTLNQQNVQLNDHSLANASRTNSRMMFFRSVEKTHPSFGKACLMRAICEVSEVPLMSASTGLLGEIVDLLLSTSAIGDESGVLKMYREAEHVGRKGKKEDKCKAKYSNCPLSLFNIVDIPFF